MWADLSAAEQERIRDIVRAGWRLSMVLPENWPPDWETLEMTPIQLWAREQGIPTPTVMEYVTSVPGFGEHMRFEETTPTVVEGVKDMPSTLPVLTFLGPQTWFPAEPSVVPEVIPIVPAVALAPSPAGGAAAITLVLLSLLFLGRRR